MNKQGWDVKNLGNICTILDSQRKPITKKDRISGIYPYYGATGIQDYINNYIFDGLFVLVGEDGAKWGANEKTAFITIGKCWVNNHAHVLKINEGISHQWIIYYLNHKDLNEFITGAVVPKLNQAALKNIPIPVPPISIQNQIVKELDTLQAIISKKKAQLVELDSLAQATFYEMFGEQFLKDYQIKSLGNLFLFIDYRGSTPNKIKTGIPLITAKNIKKGYIDFSSKDFISEDDYLKRQKRGIGKKGDILFTTEAPLGNIAIANIDRYSSGQRVIIFQANSQNKKNINNIFYMHYILSNFFQDSLDQLKTGATAKGIKASKLKNINMPVPPIGLQNQFAKRIEAIEKQKALINQSISETQLLFDSAMDNYFN